MFDENVSILVPFKSDGGLRDKNWNWIKKRYEILMPNAELCIGDSDIEPYCRSAGINNAAKLASRDIFIIADADMVIDIEKMEKAINMLSDYAWVLPFTKTNMLDFGQSEKLLNQDPSITVESIDFGPCTVYEGSLSEILIIPRKYFEKVGGFDENFKGYGYEDWAFQRSMDVICGKHGRLENTVWHLYHTQKPSYADNFGYNGDLYYRRYGNDDAIINDFNKTNKN